MDDDHHMKDARSLNGYTDARDSAQTRNSQDGQRVCLVCLYNLGGYKEE
jgi:hypothetical protein